MTLFASLPPLTPFQYNVVDNVFSLTVATMGAAAIFFFAARSLVAPKFRPALMVSGLVVAIACYHYFMIRLSWQSAYAYSDGAFNPTGKGFNDFYRYADWILTVPLLLVELVAVMGLAKEVARPLLTKLVIAAALMIGLGYPGEVSQDWTTLMIWGMLSTLPFLYILYVLWVELGKSLATQPESVRSLVSLARILIVITWMFYPIAYAIRGDSLPGAIPGIIPEKSGLGVVGTQVGYAIADLTAKAGFGMLIFFIARIKTETLSPEERAEQLQATALMT
ncbi:MAG: bacteriorhodopsin-like [Gemmataceae bacterium]|nr:bacteriorhodopsin-like [Gemmata sp.]MDW8199032.1 bacteriorhodopsin-like [Gemmataceae bacterium]